MKKIANFFRSLANMLDPKPIGLDATVELDFPLRNMSFNAAIDSVVSLSSDARAHFYRRLVLRISKEDRVVLDEHLEHQLNIDYYEKVREDKDYKQSIQTISEL